MIDVMNFESRPDLNGEALSPFELNNAVMVPWVTQLVVITQGHQACQSVAKIHPNTMIH
jgi:hypothetical protein